MDIPAAPCGPDIPSILADRWWLSPAALRRWADQRLVTNAWTVICGVAAPVASAAHAVLGKTGAYMKKYLQALTIAVAMGLTGIAAQAATILPKNDTTVLVTAPLSLLGLGGAPTGTAGVSLSDGKPLFAFGITGGTIDAAGNALIEHDGSGVQLFALADTSVSATVGTFLIDTLGGTVSGIVNGSGPSTVLFTFGEITKRGISLNISSALAGALTSVFGAPDLTGARFGFANTAPEVAPVPVAGALPLLAGGLALLGAVGLRRRRAV
jgi:hypothetical protein